MPKFLDILLGKSDGKILEVVKDTFDELIFSKEEKAKLEQENEEAQFRRDNIEREYLQKNVENHLREFKLEIEDKNSARNREIEVVKINPLKISWLTSNLNSILATMTIFFIFVIFFFLFYTERDFRGSQKEMLLMILGSLISSLGLIYNYYFGSSSGSKDKDVLLKDLMNKNGRTT
jgi:hypothetical protein